MNLKFLPIGSLCSVNESEKKLMVIGYKRDGYDYVAVEFPKGYEPGSDFEYFNHDEIIELYSYGYKNEESKVFVDSIESVSEYRTEETLDVNMGYVFNDSGIVVGDKPVVTPLEEETKVVQDTSDIFKFEENGVVVEDKRVQAPAEPERFKFDENGVVVEDTRVQASAEPERFKFDENGVVVEDTRVQAPTEPEKFKFDENGVVILDERTIATPAASGFVFDENGVVVEDNRTLEKKDNATNEANGFEFDENGVIVADNRNSNIEEAEPEVLETVELETPEVTLQFDENGMVVLDNDEQKNDLDLLFADIELPSGVELETNLDNEENLEVGTLSTGDDSAIFNEVTFTVDDIADDEVALEKQDTEIAIEDNGEIEIVVEEKTEETPKEEKKKRGFFNFL